jgi:uncharacterized protein (TIGR00369 family)
MTDLLAMAQKILATQPFSVYLGAQVTRFEPGCVELALPIAPHLNQQYGNLHGGVLAYAADNALTFAGGSVLGPLVITVEFKINYLRQAAGERLAARATVIHAGERQAVCRCDLFTQQGDDEALVATALGTIRKYGAGDKGKLVI